jgi:ribonucleoside-triphosphate reductase (formate)
MLPKVRTSDGFLVDWNRDKIITNLLKESVLAKEFFGISPMTKKEAELVTHIVENRVISMNMPFISSHVVRELVNNTLLELSASDPDFLIYKNVMTRVGTPVYDAYKIDVGDGFEKNENANLQSNPETIHKKKADLMSKEQYLLLMPPDLANKHHSGDIHIHTLEYFGSRPFCQDYDLRYFFKYGFIADGLGYKSSVAGPPKHASVAILQSVKVLAAGQTNFSGGQGFMYYTMFLAPYMRGLSQEEIDQLAQMMFFELTQTYIARGGQPVFSNIQIPMGVPKIWQNIPVVMKGKVGPDVYGNYEDEVQRFYRAIQKVSLKGDYWGKPFNFPKQENYVSPEFFKPEYDDLWLLAHENVAKNGSPYFDNMIPDYRGYGNGISCYQCCAYQFSNNPENDEHFYEKLNFVDGQHFSMGGWQVVSINLPRLAYRANGDYNLLLEYAQENMRSAIEVFKIKKMWMDSAIAHGTLPFATQTPKDSSGKVAPSAVDFSELVYVIGVVGLNEMVQHFTGKQLHESRDAVKLGVTLLIDMEKYLKGLHVKTGMKLSLARTPAESTAQTFAVQDLMSEYREMAKPLVRGDRSYIDKKNGRDLPLYYTNGTHVNVSTNLPLAEKIDIEQKFFPILSGGNIFQIWMGEAHSSPEGLYKITKDIVHNSQIGYFAYTKDLTICSDCNTTSGGLLDACPVCGSKNIKNWSRITGYYSDVSGWNEGKKIELRQRYKMKI